MLKDKLSYYRMIPTNKPSISAMAYDDCEDEDGEIVFEKTFTEEEAETYLWHIIDANGGYDMTIYEICERFMQIKMNYEFTDLQVELLSNFIEDTNKDDYIIKTYGDDDDDSKEEARYYKDQVGLTRLITLIEKCIKDWYGY